MSRKKIALWVLALLVCAGFARLGFWQYGRMQEKQKLLDRVAEVMKSRKVVPLGTDVGPWIPSWVEGVGHFADATLLLDNQQHEGRAGVRVYCVLLHDFHGGAHLVDLGWLPVGGDRKLPDVTCPTGQVDVSGLLVDAPSTGIAMGPAMQSLGAHRWLMTRVDDAAILEATKLDVARHVVRLDPKLPMGWQRDLDVLPNTLPPERHLGYAVQWWALSLAVFITALVLSIRKPRKQ